MAPSYNARLDEPGLQSNPALHGGKGAGLIDMAQAKLPVPEALILTTECWVYYREHGHLPDATMLQIEIMLDAYPDSMFSVRSGAPISMPGMMDTILNVGVTDDLDEVYEGAYQQFVKSWLGIVKSVDKARIDRLINLVSDRVQFTDMTGDPLYNPTRYRKLLSGVVQHAEGISVPDNRMDQIMACVRAVFNSWDTPRAKAYRAMHSIPEGMGTACVIQRMVMGIAPGFSGSGVMFSRDPATGKQELRGEIALNAQGEDVVSGAITPVSIDTLPLDRRSELMKLATNLEATYGDVQDIEFTYESGKLYVLQTRVAKMSARARIITACALASEQATSPAACLAYLKDRVSRGMIEKTMTPTVMTDKPAHLEGLAASPGAICGKIVFRNTPLSKVTKDCILVAEDTAPEDFPIMAKCGGILTKTGGFTCHSAVVARGIGVPAVVGANALKFTKDAILLDKAPEWLKEGAYITIDGLSGKAWAGEHEVKKSQPPREIYSLLHNIVVGEGVSIAPETYYYDCGIGNRVLLPIDPSDLERAEVQLGRAHHMKQKGKAVAIGFETQALGEDLVDSDPISVFSELATHFGPDFEGLPILYGVPKATVAQLAKVLNTTVNSSDEVSILDLLDLLEG